MGKMSAFPIIETKIQVPHRRSDLVKRPFLVNKLHRFLNKKLIIVSAPAGFGKTSLLIEFSNETDLPVCWYTLDKYDNDLRVFLDYLISSIERTFPRFGTRTRTLLKEIIDPSKDIHLVVSTLVKEIIDTIPEYFVIILDDHQAIEDQEHILTFLELFLTYLDENCHLILASRSLPALPNMALLIARQQAGGIGIDELRFSSTEIQELARIKFSHDLSIQQTELLAQRSGGWITGLQLIQPDSWDPSSISEAGDEINHQIYEYLLLQVLNQQPADLQKFLLETSVFDEIGINLCKELLGINNPLQYFELIRVKNLFITEYVGLKEKIRYQDLFRKFLQSTLRRQDEAHYRELTLLAADYYATRGEWERAINRYLNLGEYTFIADIITQISQLFFDTGRWSTLAKWIDALPSALIEQRPGILIFRGKIHAERGEYTAALSCFTKAERTGSVLGDKAKAAQALAMKGIILRYQGHYVEAITQCQQAFALVSGETAEENFAIALAHKNIGLSLIRLGQPREGRQALNRALHLFVELVNPHDIGMIHHDLGLSLELTGDLEGAIKHYKAALENWEQLGNLSPWANTLNGLGVIYLQKGEFENAETTLKDALEKARLVSDQRIEAYTLTSLGDLYRNLGRHEEAIISYDKALKIAHRSGISFIVTYSLDGLGNTHLLQGDYQQAECRLFEALDHAERHESSFEIGICKLSLAIISTINGNLSQSELFLDDAIKILETGGFKQLLSRAYFHRGFTCYKNSQYEDALNYLERSMALCDQIGNDNFLTLDALLVQPFLEYAASENIRQDTLVNLLKRLDVLQISTTPYPRMITPIPHQPTLKISGFGSPEVFYDGKKVQWPIARSKDLFFYMLQHPKGQTKEEIGATFWPDHGPERLDAVFRSTLYRLRRVVYRDCIVFEDGLYRFNWESDYWYDVHLYEDKLNKSRQEKNHDVYISLLEDALTLYKGDYLQGVYHDWAETERSRLRTRYRTTISNLANIFVKEHKYFHAIQLYQQLLNEDPFNEMVHVELMQCYYRLGDRAAAIKQYQNCVTMLREELGLTPSPETQALYHKIIS